MKIEKKEIAPSGNPRLACYLSEQDLDILLGLLKLNLPHLPITPETRKTYERMKAMRRTIAAYKATGDLDTPISERKPVQP